FCGGPHDNARGCNTTMEMRMLDPIRTNANAAVPAMAETLNILGTTLSVLSDGRALPLVVGAQLVPPDHGVPVHVHAIDDELFYIIEGELTVLDRQGERQARAGDCVPLPHGIPHGFRNTSGR